MRTILFAAGNIGCQLNMFLPVLRELAQDDGLRLVMLYLDRNPAHEQNPMFVETRELVDELRVQHFEAEMPQTRLGRLRRVVDTATSFQRGVKALLEEVRPDLVVLPNHKNFRYKAFSKIAALHDVRVLVVQDGLSPGGMQSMMPSLPRSYRNDHVARQATSVLLNSLGMTVLEGPRALTRYNRGHGSVTKVATWGVSSRKIAIDHGYEPSQIAITGQPRFDQMLTHDWEPECEALYRELGIDRGQKSLVYLPTRGLTGGFLADLDDQIAIFKAIVDGAEAQDEPVTVIAKLHRAENLEEFHRILGPELVSRMVVVQDVPLYPLLHGCTLAITLGSTAGLEALGFDKPLITMNLSDRPDFYRFAESGAAVRVTAPDQMKQAVASILSDEGVQGRLAEARARFLVEEMHTLDGKATWRVAELIRETLPA